MNLENNAPHSVRIVIILTCVKHPLKCSRIKHTCRERTCTYRNLCSGIDLGNVFEVSKDVRSKTVLRDHGARSIRGSRGFASHKHRHHWQDVTAEGVPGSWSINMGYLVSDHVARPIMKKLRANRKQYRTVLRPRDRDVVLDKIYLDLVDRADLVIKGNLSLLEAGLIDQKVNTVLIKGEGSAVEKTKACWCYAGKNTSYQKVMKIERALTACHTRIKNPCTGNVSIHEAYQRRHLVRTSMHRDCPGPESAFLSRCDT